MSKSAFEKGEPGVYPDIPEPDYHALKLPSNSFVKAMEEYSPEHAYRWREEGRRPSKAQKLGTAAHVAVFEPERFPAVYMTSCPCSAVQKNGKVCGCPGQTRHDGEWFCGKHNKAAGDPDELDREVLPPSTYHDCNCIAERIHGHSDLGPAILKEGENELSLIFVDERTGVKCKSRLDRWASTLEWVIDLKTSSKSVAPHKFAITSANFMYHHQGAFYRRAMQSLGRRVRKTCFAAIETASPYGLCFFAMRDDKLDQYDLMIDANLRKYARCEMTGEWPGYPPNIVMLDMPEWEERMLNGLEMPL